MKLGKSQPWTESLKILTGSEEMSSGATLEYFKPLRKWLVKQRETFKYGKGWQNSEDPLNPLGAKPKGSAAKQKPKGLAGTKESEAKEPADATPSTGEGTEPRVDGEILEEEITNG